jgi:hypothetical protein
MTCLEKLCRANRWRIRTGAVASTDEAGFNGYFLVPLDGTFWMVRLNDQNGWRHVAITNAQNKRLIPWHISYKIKQLFFSDEAWVVEFHPPPGNYIADRWAHHLWEPLNETLPVPPVVALYGKK